MLVNQEQRANSQYGVAKSLRQAQNFNEEHPHFPLGKWEDSFCWHLAALCESSRYIYICTYIIHILVCMYECIHVYLCMHVCVCIFMCVCIRCMYVCMCKCMYVRLYVCMYVCIYVCMYVCMYAFYKVIQLMQLFKKSCKTQFLCHKGATFENSFAFVVLASFTSFSSSHLCQFTSKCGIRI
jgi:hypothetical protein